jgi:hypothetical protein
VPRLHQRQRPRLRQRRAHVLAPAVRQAGATAGGHQAEARQHVQQGDVVHQAVQQGQVVCGNPVRQPLQHLHVGKATVAVGPAAGLCGRGRPEMAWTIQCSAPAVVHAACIPARYLWVAPARLPVPYLLCQHHAVVAGIPQPGVEGVQLVGGHLRGAPAVLQHRKASWHLHRPAAAPPAATPSPSACQGASAATARLPLRLLLCLAALPGSPFLVFLHIPRVLLPLSATAPAATPTARSTFCSQDKVEAPLGCVVHPHALQAVLLLQACCQLVHLQQYQQRWGHTQCTS